MSPQKRPAPESTDARWRARASTGSAAERAIAILDDVTLRAAAEGGRSFAVVRAIVCGLFLLRELVAGGTSTQKTQAAVVMALLALTAAWSTVAAVIIPRFEPTRRNTLLARIAGTVVDAVAFFAIILTMEIWAGADYRGVLSQPYIHFIGVLVAASGLRLDRSFVWLSAALNAAGLAVLLLLDRLWWADRLAYGSNAVTFEVGLLVSATLIGVAYADRARALALRGARRAIDAARARERLGAYLGKEVAAEALAGDDIVLGGQRQPVAVLFSDLRGFTTTAESLPPEELVIQLNAYLEDMVRVIDDEGGVVDKYLGDGIMAVFGAPAGKADDAWRALEAARGMQRALARHNQARATRGLPPLAHGVGVHYGAVVAGNVGTRDHAQYTIVGDVVNVASRLESMTKEQGVPLLFSRELLEAAEKTAPVKDVKPAGSLPVRGRRAPVDLYRLE